MPKRKGKDVANDATVSESRAAVARTPAGAIATLSDPKASEAARCSALDQLARHGALEHGSLAAAQLNDGQKTSWKLKTKALKALTALGACGEHIAAIGATVSQVSTCSKNLHERSALSDAIGAALVSAGDAAASLVPALTQQVFFLATNQPPEPSVGDKKFLAALNAKTAASEAIRAVEKALHALASGGKSFFWETSEAVCAQLSAVTLPTVLEHFSHSSADVRLKAMDVMADVLEPWAHAHLSAVRALLGDEAAAVREAAIECIERLCLTPIATRDDPDIPAEEIDACLSAIASLEGDANAGVARVAKTTHARLAAEIEQTRKQAEQAARRDAEHAERSAIAEAEASRVAEEALAKANEARSSRAAKTEAILESIHQSAMSRETRLDEAQLRRQLRAGTQGALRGDEEARREFEQRKEAIKEAIRRNLKESKMLMAEFREEEEYGERMLCVQSTYGRELDDIFRSGDSDDDEDDDKESEDEAEDAEGGEQPASKRAKTEIKTERPQIHGAASGASASSSVSTPRVPMSELVQIIRSHPQRKAQIQHILSREDLNEVQKMDEIQRLVHNAS